MGEKQTHIHQSSSNSARSRHSYGMNDRASPGCGRQGNTRGCEITPTSRIAIHRGFKREEEEEEEEYFYLTLNKHYTNTGHHDNP